MAFAFKNLLKGFASPAGRARDAAVQLGLNVDRSCPAKAEQQAFLAAKLDECAQDVVRSLHRDYDNLFASGSTLAGGMRAYAVLENAVDHFAASSDDPDICERMLDVFEEEWELNYRSPFAAAFYGTMLCNTGYAWRMSSTDKDVSSPGFQKYRQYVAHAHDVFLESAPRTGQCPFWHRMYASIGAADGSSNAEQQARFDRAVAFDPFETELYCTRMHQLLPRRHGSHGGSSGGSYAAMEAFAQDSVAATRAEMGTAMYARLYTHASYWESLPDTRVNYNLLRNSFFDWARKDKSQYVTNALASAAYDFGDLDTVNSLIAREWTEFHPAGWQSDERAAEALSKLASQRKRAKAAA